MIAMPNAAAFCLVWVALLCAAAPARAQVKLLNVGEARAGLAPDAPAVPSWMKPVPVRSRVEDLLFPLRLRELHGKIAGAGLIPGLTGPCTPQGIAALPDGRIVLTYHTEKPVPTGPAGSVLVVTDRSGAIEHVRELQDTNGLPLSSHVGGVAVAGNKIWTGSGGKLWRFPIPSGTDRWLRAETFFSFDSTVSWCAAYAGTLWVGDYYTDGEKPAGRGWAAGYSLDRLQTAPAAYITYKRDGRTVLRPDAVIYLPTTVQGFAVSLDHVFLSRSHWTKHGDLDIYRNPLSTVPRTVSLPEGHTTIGYTLTSMVNSIALPSGAEDLEWVPPYLLISFESGCTAYRDVLRAGFGAIEDRFMFLRVP